jgi:hypothetical protein
MRTGEAAHCLREKVQRSFRLSGKPDAAPALLSSFLGGRLCRAHPLQGQHCYVVLLSEGLRGGGDVMRGLRADCPGAVEAEELMLRVHGFDDSIGKERERVAGGELERGLVVFRIGGQSKWQTGIKLDLFSVAIGGKVAGIGHGDRALRRHADAEAGDEAALLRGQHLAVEAREQNAGREIFISEVRNAPMAKAPVMAAFRPLPLTSPTTMRANPSCCAMTW